MAALVSEYIRKGWIKEDFETPWQQSLLTEIYERKFNLWVNDNGLWNGKDDKKYNALLNNENFELMLSIDIKKQGSEKAEIETENLKVTKLERQGANEYKQINGIVNPVYLPYNNPDELPIVFQQLLKGRFIDKSINVDHFKSIFTGQEKQHVQVNPVKWIETIRLLAFFLNSIYGKKENWQSIIETGNLFIDKTDNPIKANSLAVALKEIRKNGKPKRSDEIVLIIKTFISEPILNL